MPRTLDSGAYLEVRGLSEEDENRHAERSFRWSDTFVKEKLTLFSNGYLYHPRFLLYRAAVTGAVSQERYESTLVPSRDWRADQGFEYDFSLHLLPEHAYNLSLFARRYEPLFTERFASRVNNVATSQGADFRYRRKPYFLHARYSDDTLTSGPISSGVRQLGLNGEYFRQFEGNDHLSLTAAFNPSRFERSSGLTGSSTGALLGNLLAYGRYRLSSHLSQSRLEQDDRQSGRFESTQLIWQERLDVELPLHFRTTLSYRQQQSENRFPDVDPSRLRGLSNVSRDLSGTLAHQLYESLTTSYSFTRSQQNSIGGDSHSSSHQLGLSYDKTIPRGRLLLGASFGRNEISNAGQRDVLSEAHPAVAVPGAFELGQANAEPASIALFLRSPVSPFESVRLLPGVHFAITDRADRLEIQILSLPDEFVLPASYDFEVSYSLAGGGFALRSNFRSVTGSVQLFNDRLTPYASHSTVSAEVLSGFYPGAIPDSTTTTAGLILRLGGLRARAEYRQVDWEASPYSSWLGELQYAGALTRSTRLYATASHKRWDYPRGRSDQPGEATNQTTDLAAVDLQQKLFARTMTLSVGGSYTENHSLFDSRARSLNASLSWKIGRTDFSAGATLYESEADGGGIAISGRSRRIYHLRLRRDLF